MQTGEGWTENVIKMWWFEFGLTQVLKTKNMHTCNKITFWGIITVSSENSIIFIYLYFVIWTGQPTDIVVLVVQVILKMAFS